MSRLPASRRTTAYHARTASSARHQLRRSDQAFVGDQMPEWISVHLRARLLLWSSVALLVSRVLGVAIDDRCRVRPGRHSMALDGNLHNLHILRKQLRLSSLQRITKCARRLSRKHFISLTEPVNADLQWPVEDEPSSIAA